MRNETTKTVVPKLRFPEFRDEPGWSELKLADNLYEHRLKSDGKSEVHSVSVHKGVINQVEHLGRSFSAADTSKYNLAKPFDIIYTKSPTGDFPYGVVKQNLTGKNVIVSPLYGVFKPANEYIGNLIHAYFEDPGRTSNYLVSLVQKGAKNTLQISNDRFLSKEIYLPTNGAEQQKIAATLSSLDDLLTAHSAKLAALQALKRGLMQGLFPAEGETVPKLRFPEFREAGEWEEKKLGSLIEIKGRIGYRGYTVEDIVKEGEGAISLSPSNIDNSGNLTFNKATFISWEKYDESPEIMLENGFTVLVKTGSTYGKVAFVKNLPEKTTINPQIVVLKPTRINNIFLFLLVCNSSIQKQIEAHVVGGAIPTLSQGSVMQFDILVPDENEQQKIADCLSSLDNCITAQTQKIEALKLHKKGLMQALFPASTEPTV